MIPPRPEQIAALLQEYGRRLALRGGNPYSARAYVAAAEQVAALGDALGPLVEKEELTALPGVGAAIAGLITRLYREGTDPKLETMRAEFPAGLLDMLRLPGIRAEQVRKIYEATGIAELTELERALRSGSIKGQKGFTASFQAKLLQAIELQRRHANALHVGRGWALAEGAKQNLARIRPDLRNITIAGDCRRGCELISDIALVAIDPTTRRGAQRALGPRVTLFLCPPEAFGAALLFATGAPAHIEALCKVAQERGMRLTADGLRKADEPLASETEEQIYRALDLPYIEPELREGGNEFVIAASAARLISAADIRGVLHAHTDSSDGVDTLEAMAEAAHRAGYDYFGVTDHSQSAHYAGGLSTEEIARQQKEADRLNRAYGRRFRIFKGIESDIRPDGSLDYPEQVLGDFDLVIASVHGQFKMSVEEQTARIVKAVQNPYTTILGHMTGRQLLRRPGYEVDIDAVLKACGAHGVAVEVNCNPWRLDLDWRWHQLALKYGCLMSINPDAHSTEEIDMMRWGVEIARKGGVPKDRVLTALGLAEFAAYLDRRKSRQAPAARASRRRKAALPS